MDNLSKLGERTQLREKVATIGLGWKGIFPLLLVWDVALKVTTAGACNNGGVPPKPKKRKPSPEVVVTPTAAATTQTTIY